MIKNLSRRLERLEAHRAPSGIQHVITVIYVADGSQAGSGYRIEGPLPGGEWRRTSLRQEDGHVG